MRAEWLRVQPAHVWRLYVAGNIAAGIVIVRSPRSSSGCIERRPPQGVRVLSGYYERVNPVSAVVTPHSEDCGGDLRVLHEACGEGVLRFFTEDPLASIPHGRSVSEEGWHVRLGTWAERHAYESISRHHPFNQNGCGSDSDDQVARSARSA